MPATVLNRLNVPPLYAELESFVWKKWLDDVYTEFYKNGQPLATITSSNQTLGLEFFTPVDATSGSLVVNLPKASDAKGKKYIIKKIDGTVHTVTITPHSGDSIDGSSTKVLSSQWDAVFIESDGNTNWFVLLGSGGGSTGAPVDATYVVMSSNATLTQERVLTAGSGITITDGGANSTVTISADNSITVTAGENIAAGQFVALYNDAGTPKCRVAKSSSGQGYQADGFCKAAFLSGATATVYLSGSINVAGGTGLTGGDVWLGTGGYATNTPPTTVGYISQQIGVAKDGTTVAFEPQPDILIATTHAVGTGGTTQSTVITNTQTITIGTGGAFASMIGGGGGGGPSANGSPIGGGGGGAGEYCQNFLIPFTIGESVTFTIGAGGTSGTDGGDTSISCLAGTFLVKGGKGATGSSGAAGGGPRGATGGTASNPGNIGSLGTAETPCHFGGSSGGGAGNSANSTGGRGGGSSGDMGTAGTAGNANGAGGGSGGSSPWGAGAAGGTGNAAGSNAAANSGAGGGGGGGNNGTGQAGGTGGSGLIILIYTA